MPNNFKNLDNYVTLVDSPIIRRATVQDLPALLLLESLFPTDRINRRNFRRLLKSESADVFVYEMNKELCGNAIMLYRRRNSVGRLYSLVVHPSHQRKGIARALLRAADEASIKRGCKYNKLEVRADNISAIKLYESDGYQCVAFKNNFYEDNTAAACMLKQLVKDDVKK